MLVDFVKMHALGNDFVIINLIAQQVQLNSAQVQRIADRRLGIGCDQLILIHSSDEAGIDFYYKIYNPDGQEVEQCGNGARCAAKFFFDESLGQKASLRAKCIAGSVVLNIEVGGVVNANFFMEATKVHSYLLQHKNTSFKIHAISVGNPHGVCVIKDFNEVDAESLGACFSTSHIFPNGANIGFMQIINRHCIKLKVYERGAGQTLACGTGASAAVLVGQYLGLVDNKNVAVIFEYGCLRITHDNREGILRVEGSTDMVFRGRYEL